MTDINIAPAAARSELPTDVSPDAGQDVTAVPPTATADARAIARDGQRRGMDPLFGVRTADIEPYTGLRYLSKLFRMIAVVLVLLLIAEVVTGLITQGTDSISTLLGEVSRLLVLAGLLWGVGDFAILLIDVGHDVRAARILIGRQTAHLSHHPHEGQVAGPPALASATLAPMAVAPASFAQAAAPPRTAPTAVPVHESRVTPRT